jgi:hypothetical protein
MDSKTVKSTREKRLFKLAESLAEHIAECDGQAVYLHFAQPEDLLPWLQMNVPTTDEEYEEDAEQLREELKDNQVQSRGRSAIGKLRDALGFAPGGSIISVIEKAAEVCAAEAAR